MPLSVDTTRPVQIGRFFVLATLLAGAGPACERDAGREREDGLSAVAIGMTMGQVVSVWGRPNVRVREAAGERWSYWVRDGSSQVVGRAYVVFDERKRVRQVLTGPRAGPARPPRKDPVTIG